MSGATAEIAVIGGSGFYSFLTDPHQLSVPTPYGDPSAPVTVGSVGDRLVAFLPRHGSAHQFPPHRLNYRANMWALHSLGVTRVIAPSAVGSLRPDLHPGDLMVLDQVVDRTSGRGDTYLDGPEVDHVSFADPYCPELGSVLHRVGSTQPDMRILPRGTVVVIQGPRFSTRAESRWFRAAGWDVVNMTQYPEAVLARELGLCYSGLALVTDYDTGVGDDRASGDGAVSDGVGGGGAVSDGVGGGGAVSDGVGGGVDGGEAVTMDAVMAVLAANVDRTRSLLVEVIPEIPTTARCTCAAAGSRFLRS